MHPLTVPQVSAISLCGFSHQNIRYFRARKMAQFVTTLATQVWEYEFNAQNIMGEAWSVHQDRQIPWDTLDNLAYLVSSKPVRDFVSKDNVLQHLRKDIWSGPLASICTYMLMYLLTHMYLHTYIHTYIFKRGVGLFTIDCGVALSLALTSNIQHWWPYDTSRARPQRLWNISWSWKCLGWVSLLQDNRSLGMRTRCPNLIKHRLCPKPGSVTHLQ